MSSVGVGRRDAIVGALDPVVGTISRWTDEDPAAMRRLLEDAALRSCLGAALDRLLPRSSETRLQA